MCCLTCVVSLLWASPSAFSELLFFARKDEEKEEGGGGTLNENQRDLYPVAERRASRFISPAL